MKYIKHIFSLITLIMLVVFTSSTFGYQRTYPPTKNEVKGINTFNSLLPYPKNSEQKSITVTNEYVQEVLKSIQNYNEIYGYYDNLFDSTGFNKTYFFQNNDIISLEYKSENDTFNLNISTLSNQKETTITIQKSN